MAITIIEAYKNAQGRQINPTIDLIGAVNSETTTVEDLRNLIAQGGNVDQTDAKGETPLMLSARYILPEFVEVLIEQGADVNGDNKIIFPINLLQNMETIPHFTIIYHRK